MATFAADSDLLEYEPDIASYGIQQFTELHEKTYDDIIRLLRIEWWPRADYGRYDISIVTGRPTMNEDLVLKSQFIRAACYHVMAFYIYPRLSTFDPQGDVFREKMAYYKEKFRDEFDLCLREGVKYDFDSSGTITDSEDDPVHFNRLVR
jgi:hypothetical protein